MKPQVCARCFWKMAGQVNIDGMKLLNNKIVMTDSIEPFD